MRLINTSTLQIEAFNKNDVPKYAIVSHTWGREEVTWAEMASDSPVPRSHIKHKEGYRKVKAACDMALSQHFEWIWIDTCCINKSSTAELSEALNSMWRWYKDCRTCYAYLEDVEGLSDLNSGTFSKSRWFTRGWTLKELLAPSQVIFLSRNWKYLGAKSNMCEILSQTTGIHKEALESNKIENYSIAQRMSWASNRVTTVPEDIAYCLFGLFDVKMPLLYGEGEVKAFKRLQEALIKDSDDQSVFAWRPEEYTRRDSGNLLADSPSDFSGSREVLSFNSFKQVGSQFGFTLTNAGLRITLPIMYPDHRLPQYGGRSPTHWGLLRCVMADRDSDPVVLPLSQISESNRFIRAGFAHRIDWPLVETRCLSDTIYICKQSQTLDLQRTPKVPLPARLWEMYRWVPAVDCEGQLATAHGEQKPFTRTTHSDLDPCLTFKTTRHSNQLHMLRKPVILIYDDSD